MSEEAKYPGWDGTEGLLSAEIVVDPDAVIRRNLAKIPEQYRVAHGLPPILDAPVGLLEDES